MLIFNVRFWKVTENLCIIIAMDTQKEDIEVTITESCYTNNECIFAIGSDYRLTDEMETILSESYPEIVILVNKLHRFIQRQQNKIKNLKLKLKKTCDVKDAATQTDEVCQEVPKNISEEIKEAAEMAVQNTGFVYEETSGLYYDYNTGYYYNAELGLYYDGNSGTYMTYNQETESYEFHSQTEVPICTTASSPLNLQKRKKDYKENTQVISYCDVENLLQSFTQMNISSLHKTVVEIAKGWPPCLRIIIKSTSVPKMKEGSLYIITYQGGSLGREGDHSIVIPDINISKHHLKFNFNKETSYFSITDMGSRNGTLLNGKRISPSKQESEPVELNHGSCIQVGSTILLCHVHSGNETCGHCEPGLLQSSNEITKLPKTVNKSETHKKELQKLRKKFGVDQLDKDNTQLAEGYTDRAHIRRLTVGSHNEREKTETASVDKSISSDNKGFKLLSKMGWTEGKSLGKEGTGVLNPIELQSTIGTTGMGYKGESSNSVVKTKTSKENIWQKTQKRYQQLPSSDDNIFEESD